jgi:hypothetical protein
MQSLSITDKRPFTTISYRHNNVATYTPISMLDNKWFIEQGDYSLRDSYLVKDL